MSQGPQLFRCSVSRARLTCLGVAVLLGSPTSRVLSQATSVRPLAYTRFTLPNGLVAILNESHSTPIVSAQVWYHVGSKDDAADQPGTAHLCEHLMSLGSPHLDQPQPTFYRSIGATTSGLGKTTEDVTAFTVTVPSSELETVLWAESDRMAAPLATVDSQRLAGARRVVEQERRQDIDNVPFGASREITFGALFPAGHPYHLTPLSQPSPSPSPVDPRATCLRYYTPNNAVIAISGDFETAQARALVEKYFGGIPRRPLVARRETAVAPLVGEQRLVLEDARATQPQLHLDWRGAAYASEDRAAILAAASALSLPRFGRLSELLVDDRQLATSVKADNYDLERAGVFEIIVLPRPGASMTVIEQLVDSTLASLDNAPVTPEEIARFNAYNGVSAATSLQLNVMRADTLAHDQTFTGDPTSYVKQANAALRLTPADVRAAIHRYLGTGRVVMSLVPAGRLDLISRPDLPYANVSAPQVHP
jgi:zinc protease